MTTDDAQRAEFWNAPQAHGAVDATIRIPGSKSATNRALILACLADGPSTIRGALDARDTRLMSAGLRLLGNDIEVVGDGDFGNVGNVDLAVTPHYMTGDASIDVGLAGTVMRFLPPAATLAHGLITFDGDAQARRRPIATVIESLKELGAEVFDRGTGRLPFAIQATGELRGGEVTLDASRSSQFVSGLLLSAARFDTGVTIHHVGEPVPSMPHILMTEAMLAQHGVTVHRQGDSIWHIDPHEIKACDWAIEPDLSNAAPFLAAAMVTAGSVTVLGWPHSTTQPGDQLRHLLAAMGAEVTLHADGLTVRGTGSIQPIDADLREVGELTPTLAALAALAEGPSRFSGIGHLRHHETDRLAALETELAALGCTVVQFDDGLSITPGPLTGTRFRTYEDHRMATAAAIIGLRVPGVQIENIDTTAKTLPHFAERWTNLAQA